MIKQQDRQRGVHRGTLMTLDAHSEKSLVELNFSQFGGLLSAKSLYGRLFLNLGADDGGGGYLLLNSKSNEPVVLLASSPDDGNGMVVVSSQDGKNNATLSPEP